MREILLLIFSFFLSLACFSQVGIGTTNPDDSSVLDVTATDKGILVPRVALNNVATTMLDGVNTAATGLLIYNTNAGVIGGSGVGYYYFNGTSWKRLTTSTDSSNKWSLSGNAGTVLGTNFLGTTDNNALSFRTNNLERLRITNQGKLGVYNTGRSVFIGEFAGDADNLSNNYNVAIGYNTYTSAINSVYNVAIGSNSQPNNNGGTGNTSVGQATLLDLITGNYNSAVGMDALHENISGSYNLALGSAAMYDNTSGANNVAAGTAALADNTIGGNNVAIGFHALRENITGAGSVASGYRALYNNNASFNAAYGQEALFGNTSGVGNQALGYRALYNTSTGGNNIALGAESGYLNLIGSSNVFLGYQAGYNETGSNKLYIESSNALLPLIYGDFGTDVLRINGNVFVSDANGTYANATISVNALEISDLGGNNLGLDGDIVPFAGSASAYDLGNNNATEHWDDVVATTYITYSDRNTKNEIQPIKYGLQEILALEPVSYRYKPFVSPNYRLRMGLIAQDVEQIIPEVVITDDVDIDENGNRKVTQGEFKAMNYMDLIPVLIKAVQEQDEKINRLEKQIEILKDQKQ